MKNLIQKHKTKIVVASPLFLLILLVLGATYASSFKSLQVVKDKTFDNELALQQFANLNIKAKAFVVYDGSQKKVIYARNEIAQLPLASLTKIMSTLVALDLTDKNTIIDVPSDNKFNNVNDKYTLVPGSWKLSDLLKLTLVTSSNSGINIISDRLSSLKEFLGGEKHFVELMNKKAGILRLNQTYFLNESGLDIDDNLAGAYGSPLDTAILFDYALRKYPDIFDATRYNSITINSTRGDSLSASNTNPSVSQIKNLVASKTGFTDLAQGNLVIAFDIDQKTRIIVVVLGSTQDDRFFDAEALAKATIAYYSVF